MFWYASEIWFPTQNSSAGRKEYDYFVIWYLPLLSLAAHLSCELQNMPLQPCPSHLRGPSNLGVQVLNNINDFPQSKLSWEANIPTLMILKTSLNKICLLSALLKSLSHNFPVWSMANLTKNLFFSMILRCSSIQHSPRGNFYYIITTSDLCTDSIVFISESKIEFFFWQSSIICIFGFALRMKTSGFFCDFSELFEACILTQWLTAIQTRDFLCYFV